MKGTVKFFNKVKGFGFIEVEKGDDIFVHYTGISGNGRRNLDDKDSVEFDVEEGKKGMQAVNVVKL